MPKPWLKSWSSSLDNPKIQLLTGDQFKAWTNLLWIALRYDREGELPPMQLIAFQLRMEIKDAHRLCEEQIQLGLLENVASSYVVHDWKHWQGEGKSDAERQAEKRERDKLRDMSRDINSECHGDDRKSSENGEPPSLSPPTPPLISSPETRQDKNPPTPRKRGKPSATATDCILPSWLPPEDLNAWLRHRAAIKHPVPPESLAAVIRKLDRFRQAGHDPLEILEAGIVGGHQGLFAPSDSRSNGKPAKKPVVPEMDTSQIPDWRPAAEAKMAELKRIGDEVRRKRAEAEAAKPRPVPEPRPPAPEPPRPIERFTPKVPSRAEQLAALHRMKQEGEKNG